MDMCSKKFKSDLPPVSIFLGGVLRIPGLQIITLFALNKTRSDLSIT